MNRIKKKMNTMVSIVLEKTCDRIQHPVHFKNSKKTRNERETFQLDRENL